MGFKLKNSNGGSVEILTDPSITTDEIIYIKQLQGDSIPIGGIIMYHGSISAIPSNYRLCDGSNGTPNLANRFVMGTTGTTGVTGGSNDAVVVSHNHTITDNGHLHSGTTGSENENHTHVFSATTSSDGQHGHLLGIDLVASAGQSPDAIAVNTGISVQGQPSNVVKASGLHNHTLLGTSAGVSAAHAHSFNTSTVGTGISINDGGVSGTNANIPAYVALAYIMRIG